jgi:calcium-dependent protein kinase
MAASLPAIDSKVSPSSSSPSSTSTPPQSGYVIGHTKDIRKDYKFDIEHDRIGAPGQFGYAVRAIHISSGEKRAIKIVSKARFIRGNDELKRRAYFAQLRDEITVMKRMKHDNIIHFYDVYEDNFTLYVVMELCIGGELFDRIKSIGSYSEKDASIVLRQLCCALNYMHCHNIAHCDLKPDNFLFLTQSSDSPIKIIDFGMSKFCRSGTYFKTLCGTPYYVAPEVLRGRYNQHSDMWSLGVVMFVMIFGYPPFYAEEDDEIFKLVKHGFRPITQDGYGPHFPIDIPCSQSAKDLMAKMLTLNVAERITASEALDHPWLKGHTASSQPIGTKMLEKLRSFEANSKFKQAVLMHMTKDLSDTEIDELKKTFSIIDENGDGKITIDELSKAMTKTGSSSSSASAGASASATPIDMKEVERLFIAADIDQNGVIDYNEMLMTAINRKLLAKEERLWDAFRTLDVDGDGVITKQEIMQVLGKDATYAEELLKEVDADNNGTIEYDEFITLWMKRV